MKAAVQHSYGAPEEAVAIEDVPLPDLGDDEVLLKVRAAGVNWADWSMTRGMPYLMRAGYGLRKPRSRIRGTDVAGAVEIVGATVEQFAPGDEVFGWCTSAFAEHVAVKADQLISKPAALTFEEAAGIPMAGCVALQAMRDVAKVNRGDTVLVNGASGGIGSFAVQVAKSLGAEVTGVCSAPNLEMVRSLGADYVIDYGTDDYTRLGKRYDVILDIADNRTIAERRKVLTRNGTLIPNSGEGGPFFGSVGRIIKAWLVTPFVSQRLRAFLSLAKREDLLVLRDLIEAGELEPVVGASYPLADTGAAIRHAGSGHARGKVIVTI
ncbi:MAG TPA: NAD(P)-dependent alcohol dehydrogenase [Acidimicrobiia bacterium]|jgi:NADPH:quinone reductase-like Zn-dependent oxidoreductase|nr:NAD(P)-dependent alcohol dehydrogenase [Acidimicrobiia bacterium]